MAEQRNNQRKNDQIMIDKLNEIAGKTSDIAKETHEVNQKIDDLEQHLTKKAIIAGGIAGTVSGTLSSSFFSLGIEMIKAKYGG